MSFSVYLSSVFCFELLMLRAFLAVPYKNIYRGNKKHSKKRHLDILNQQALQKNVHNEIQWKHLQVLMNFSFNETPQLGFCQRHQKPVSIWYQKFQWFCVFVFSINGPCFLSFFGGWRYFHPFLNFIWKERSFQKDKRDTPPHNPSPESLQGELLLVFKRSYKPYK